ncbi:MAG TPA: hypothetical protein VK550_21805 [Polyangiaceae bacterium]|nr:hypothetical protein [Polyangiaceae bacterium]
MMSTRLFCCAAAAAALLGVSPARSAPASAPSGIALRTDGGEDLDEPGLRLALQNTLGVSINEPRADRSEPLATVVVRRHSDGSVTIVFVRPDGREVERTLDLPSDRKLATETIALAAGNLVRDEAAELVATLTPPPAASPEVLAPPDGPTVDAAAAPAPPTTRRVSCTDAEPIFFGADFAPYAGTSSKYPDRRRTLSFNFVGGYARGLRGFELGVGANIESAFMCGAQIAAGANVVLGDVHGVQIAVANVALGAIEGVQLGVVSVAKGDIEGAQIGAVSLGGGSLVGVQLGVVNALGGSVNGNQSGVVNLASSDVRGAQIGVVNVAHGAVDGVQVGTTNVATGEVRGAQVGVVNYADVSDYPIGVVSVVRHGRTSADGWVTESGIGMVGVRHGGRVIHNVYGVGYRAGSTTAWSFALGLGVRAELAPKLHVDFEAIAYWLQRGQPFSEDAQVSSLGASFGYALTPVFGIFAAPTLNVLVTPDKELSNVGPPWSTSLLYEDTTVTVRAWPGGALGVRASL